MRDGRKKKKKKDWTQTDISNSHSGLAPFLARPIPQPLMFSIAPASPRIQYSLAEC